MRLNIIMLIIALLLGGLMFYGFFIWSDNLLIAIGSSVMLTITAILGLSINLTDFPRSTVMFKTMAGILFFVYLVLNILFVWVNASNGIFIIANGVLGVVGAIILYSIYKSRQ